jgi:hypothetical protein
MAGVPDIRAFDTEDEFHHVQFRDPDDFDTIRTPDWAERVADSVVDGGEVRTGKLKDSDEWKVESVLIPKDVDEETARDQAKQIIEKIESE